MGRIVQQCLRSLGSYKMRIGETAEAAEYLELFRNEDPYSEDIAAMLITAYGRLGDYKNANRVYREYEDLYLRGVKKRPVRKSERRLRAAERNGDGMTDLERRIGLVRERCSLTAFGAFALELYCLLSGILI